MSIPTPDPRPSTPDLPPRGASREAFLWRCRAFLVERFPLTAGCVLERVERALGRAKSVTEARLTTMADTVIEGLRAAFGANSLPENEEATPFVGLQTRHRQALDELSLSLRGFFTRERVLVTLSADDRRWMLRGLYLTRAVDNRLKKFFMSGEVRFLEAGFQGKGFRSLGQEAIYAAALRLKRGGRYRKSDGAWEGDVVAPLIRDLGLGLAFGCDLVGVFRAQMGKAGPPMQGRDFHIGDWEKGVLPATAPLSVSTCNIAGIAMAFRLRGEARVAVSCIGEGGSSLGEWHAAINLCAARKAPAIFCVQNNQTALSTPVSDQSAVRVFADKGMGYGVPALTVDGTDPEAVAAAFAWAAEHARGGQGPVLLELTAMRMCGHAHHDDMLYYGAEPKAPGYEYPHLADTPAGYVDADLWKRWSTRDPLKRYESALLEDGVVEEADLARWKDEIAQEIEAAAAQVRDDPWPDPALVGHGVFAGGEDVRWHEPLEVRDASVVVGPGPAVTVEQAPPFSPKGQTYLEAICRAVGEALECDQRVFVYGQDVGGRYGNAFLVLRPLLERFGARILNSPLSESAIGAVLTGAALAGMRPIGEIQFGDFIATGFNQIVNNAAKVHYRWGQKVPWVLRMPTGGLRRAGPYHSQNTEAWFYRTAGLKIVCPATPYDVLGLFASAVADDNPVMFYEPIALYRAPDIKQELPAVSPEIPLGKAAFRRLGHDLSIICYGTMLREAMNCAASLAEEDVEAEVLDLRSLVPLDWEAVAGTTRRTHRVLLLHEDSVQGSIGQSLAAQIQERLFELLDAPVRVVGALDAPVPYAPTLEDAFLPGPERILNAARLLARF